MTEALEFLKLEGYVFHRNGFSSTELTAMGGFIRWLLIIALYYPNTTLSCINNFPNRVASINLIELAEKAKISCSRRKVCL